MQHLSKSNVFAALGALLVLGGAGCFGVIDDGAPIAQPVEDISEPLTPVNTDSNTAMTYSAPTILPADQIEGKYIHIQTEKGEIVIEVYADTAPLTVSNFVNLTNQGYYNGLTFHRREEGFVIQGGDPNGNGTGGPGYKFADELNDDREYVRGTVAMANAGPNTNGSQFFIMLGDVGLPKAYSIFGTVVKGMDVVDQIRIGDEMTEVTIQDKK